MLCIAVGVQAMPSLTDFDNGDTLRTDTVDYSKSIDLNDVVVVGSKTIITHKPDRIIYLTKNDPFAKGLNGIEVIQRIPRVSYIGDVINVAGKNNVRYILDGKLLETSDAETMMSLKNLRADDIERIELLTVPPSKYPADANVAYISIKKKRDETLGVGGNLDMNLVFKEHLNSSWGAGVKQASKKIDYNVNLNYSNNKVINDLYREYTFADYIKYSQRKNNSKSKVFNVNTILKYRPVSTLEIGTMLNVYTERLQSDINDATLDRGTKYLSLTTSPAKPDNAATVTAYCDWMLDSRGKILSLTYNFFNKSTESYSLISTIDDVSEKNISNIGDNKYKINSLKLDATLPFSQFDIEAGGSFTAIKNRTSMEILNKINGDWLRDETQSNHFDYSENTSALYFTISKHLTPKLFTKAGIRYEHTALKGIQANNDERIKQSYNKLFPSFNIDYNSDRGLGISASYTMGISRPRFMDLNPFRYYTTATDYSAGNAYLSASITHNIELNVSFKGLYAVLYNNKIKDGIGYVTIFNDDNSQYTIPQNHIDYNKYGLYVSYQKNLTNRLNLKLGAEVFYAQSKSGLEVPKLVNVDGWSGKLEGSTDIAFNKNRTFLFSLGYIHMFPYNEEMARYKSIILLNANMRYMLMDGKLQLKLSVNDPFSQNITSMTKVYSTYTEYSRNNVHSRNVSIKLSYLFGGKKIKDVYRDNKETDSNRSF